MTAAGLHLSHDATCCGVVGWRDVAFLAAAGLHLSHGAACRGVGCWRDVAFLVATRVGSMDDESFPMVILGLQKAP